MPGRCIIGKPSAPTPPDPKDTAAASTGSNIGTAIANSWLNNVNQITPDGSLTYETTGYRDYTDPFTGQTYKIPIQTATQTLSEAQQGIKDQLDGASLNLAGLANDQSGAIRDRLNKPFEYTNSDAEQWAYDLASPRILAQQQQNEAALRTALANKGIREGSAAWNAEMNRLTQGNSDQLNQLALTGRQQAYNEARDQYTLPINTISALMSGSQVSNPNYVNTPQSTIANTDVAGLINQNYNQQLGIWQQQQQGLGGLLSGLGSLGGSLIGLSDERTKKDVEKRGEIDGMGVYEFRYKGEPEGAPKHTGLMAQEVAETKPEAVQKGGDGLMYVDYAAALKPKGKSVPKIKRKR